MITLFGLPLHLYGLIIGLAIVTGWHLLEKVCLRYQKPWTLYKRLYLVILVAGVLSARIWHVVTDWSLYQNQPWRAMAVWQGGLSIVGAIGGGLFVLFVVWLIKRKYPKNNLPSPLVLTDSIVHVLPVSQAMGRIANWINQELYGLPSTLPWAIPIDVEHRLPEVIQQERFHPLFAYEMLVTIGIAIIIWRRKWHIGTGAVTGWYLFLYSSARILLDFLRIDRGDYVWIGLSLNQWVLLSFGAVGICLLLISNYQATSAKIGK